MITEEIKIKKITAADGKWLSPVVNNAREPIFSKEVFLSVNNSAENWHEVDDLERDVALEVARELHDADAEKYRNS